MLKKNKIIKKFCEALHIEPTDYYKSYYDIAQQDTEPKFTQFNDNIKIIGLPMLSNNRSLIDQQEIMDFLDCYIQSKSCFFQIDPTQYLSSSRRISQQKLKQETKLEKSLKIFSENPIRPINQIELHYNPVILKGFTKNQNITINEEKDLIQKHALPKNNILYPELHSMFQHKAISPTDTYFFDIPSLFARIQLGSFLNLNFLKDELKRIIKYMIENKIKKKQIGFVSRYLMADLLGQTRDVHMKCILNHITFKKLYNDIALFVELPHFYSLQRCLDNEDMEISFEKLYLVQEQHENETDQDLIEKHALLDVILDTQVWNQPYVVDQFPYLKEKNPEDIQELQKIYFKNLKKYQLLLNKAIID